MLWKQTSRMLLNPYMNLSVDDDHQKLSSPILTEKGMIKTYNPRKGLGPDRDAMVSVNTGLMLATANQHRHAGMNESVDQILNMVFDQPRHNSNLNSNNNEVFIDRGYSTIEIKNKIQNKGLTYTATTKKNASCFAASNSTVRAFQTEVDIEGHPSAYFATIKDSKNQTVTDTAYVSGKENIVLLKSNSNSINQISFDYIFREEDKPHVVPEDAGTGVAGLYTLFEDGRGLLILTKEQRTADWTLGRKFCATGTTAIKAIVQYAVVLGRLQGADGRAYKSILDNLSINYSETEESWDFSKKYPDDVLMKLKKTDLENIVNNHNIAWSDSHILSTHGRKKKDDYLVVVKENRIRSVDDSVNNTIRHFPR